MATKFILSVIGKGRTKLLDSYVLEIPDLGYVVNQDTISRWEVFLRPKGKGSQKIRWQASSSASGLMFRNLSSKDSPVESVQIDFTANRIIIRKKKMEDQEFRRFLQFLLGTFFIKVGADELHFVVSLHDFHRKNFSAKE
jgi:hypothetical protein